jgi:hypothetical protein
VTQPSFDQIERSLNALRTCGAAFETAATGLSTAATAWGGELGDGGLRFGVFAPVGAAYSSACQALAAAGQQGNQKLAVVGTTLVAVAKAYELDEENNVHASQGKW